MPDPSDLLREHGIPITAQRLAVMRAVSARPHSTADTIAEEVRAKIGTISRQAVYDSLAMLTKKGLIRRIQPAGSSAVYEDRVGDNHHHVICRTCGKTEPPRRKEISKSHQPNEKSMLTNPTTEELAVMNGVAQERTTTTLLTRGTRSVWLVAMALTYSVGPNMALAQSKSEENMLDISKCPEESSVRGSLQLRRRVQEARSRCPEEGSHRTDDGFAGLVAGRLRALWSILHPHGLAQRRHLSRDRWPRRCIGRHATLRATQQLA